MSSDLFDTPGHSIDSLAKNLTEVKGYNPELRVSYEETPPVIFLDESAIIDYLENQGRKIETRIFGDNYFEGPQDIEKLLENFPNKIAIPERFEDLRTGKFGRSLEENEIRRRLEIVDSNSTYVNLDEVDTPEGFKEVGHADHRDKRIAGFGYEENAVIATYDDDFLSFPINYTTPGMLL
ncbi:MAG: hypothetical protein BRC28_03395 [Nanohaloarchaea archaeon SW_4_43_9]|nr:MAG: hypothetical protein BRC28_03395 [Nanohaloarchaea archaeon SW_4_43_9]